MRQALSENDIDRAISYFDQRSKDSYKELFYILSPYALEIAQDLSDIQLINMTTNTMEFDIRIIREGKEYSYLLIFVKDDDGLWKILTL